jgi:bacillithiol system protein YtxJ
VEVNPMSEIPILQTEEEVEAIFTTTGARPFFLFKHSLTCPISAGAHRRFERFIGQDPGADCGLIEIQNSRALSKAVAVRAKVRHESPQALLVHGGKVIWHASHGSIHEDALRQALGTAT